jgi:hypothetical protein
MAHQIISIFLKVLPNTLAIKMAILFAFRDRLRQNKYRVERIPFGRRDYIYLPQGVLQRRDALQDPRRIEWRSHVDASPEAQEVIRQAGFGHDEGITAHAIAGYAGPLSDFFEKNASKLWVSDEDYPLMRLRIHQGAYFGYESPDISGVDVEFLRTRNVTRDRVFRVLFIA